MLISAALLVILVACVILMYRKRLSAMLALPLLALLFAIVAGIPEDYLLNHILQRGPLQVAPAIMASIFGGILAMFIKNRGVVELMIRYTAELVGDRPLVLALSLMFITAAIFTTLGELGTVIMVGSIILPIMLHVGISPVTSAAVMLIGLAMGGMLNIRNWQLYINVLDLTRTQVRDFAIIMVGLFALFGIIFCMWYLRASQLHRFFAEPQAPVKPPLHRLALLSPITPLLFVLFFDWPIVPAFIVGLLFAILASSTEGELAIVSLFILLANVAMFPAILPGLYDMHIAERHEAAAAILNGTLVLLPFLAWTIYQIARNFRRRKSRRAHLAVLSPILPLFLIHAVQLPITIAFIAGLVLALVLTIRHETVQVLTKSIIEAFENVGPAIFLIIGIGMLLETVNHESISAAFNTLIRPLIPEQGISRTAFIVVFGALAPLALYRGPLNIWGMGSGFAAIMLATQALSAEKIMAVLLAVGAVQGVCDPTNSHNFWIANYLKVEPLDLTKRTLPFIWPMAIIALIIAGWLYFGQS